MTGRNKWLLTLFLGVLLAAAGAVRASRDHSSHQRAGLVPGLTPEQRVQTVVDAYTEQLNLPVGQVTISLHASVTSGNAAQLAAEIAQKTRLMAFAQPPVEDSPSLFVTFSLPDNADWLDLDPTIPELELLLASDVLLPGRQVFLLEWQSTISTEDGQPLPAELSFLAAGFDSLAVFDEVDGVVHDSIMSLPALDMTEPFSAPEQIYLPYIGYQSMPAELVGDLSQTGPSAPNEPAYAETPTHYDMGKQAAELAGQDPLYIEMADQKIVSQIADGDVAEDDWVWSDSVEIISIPLTPLLTIDFEESDARLLRHFYDPDSQQGLEWKGWFRGLVLLSIPEFYYEGEPIRFIKELDGERYPSALDWGRDQHADGLDWEAAIEMYDYHISSKELAYRWAGHVVHLIQDMAQPDHPRLRPHAGLPDPDQGLNRKVGYEELWKELSGQWTVPAVPGCPFNLVGQTLDDFFNSMAIQSIEQSSWWEDEYKSPNGDELSLGLTNMGAFKWVLLAAGGHYDPQLWFIVSYKIPVRPTISLAAPEDFRTMGELLIPEAVGCSAALLRFYYDIVNHPPYVQQVIVRQPGAGFPDDIAYQARWEDRTEIETLFDPSSRRTMTVTKLIDRQLVTDHDQPLQDNALATIEIHFGPNAAEHGGAGKEVDEDSVQVEIGNLEVTKIFFGRIEDDGPLIWKGEFIPDPLTADLLAVTIQAGDLHKHFAGRASDGSVLDSNPQTPAKAKPPGPSYEWSGYEPGADQNHFIFHKFKISHHETVAFLNEDADAILAESTALLRAIDGDGDVACPLRLVRDEDVSMFTFSDGIIDTRDEQETLLDMPGNAKVVAQINYCYPTFNTSIVGCAERPGDSFIVEFRATYPWDGVLWAHAFGLNQGLSQCTSGCQMHRLMNYYILSSNRIIDAAECAGFLAPRPTSALAEFAPLSLGQQHLASDLPVEDFVRRFYINGIPYHQARRYGPDDVDILLEMLQEPAEAPFWPNIVTTLGMIGDEKALQPLIQFIARGSDAELSPTHYKAISAAIGSLGYLLHETGNREILLYLRDSLEPAAWTDRIPSWSSPFHATSEERDVQLSIMAIIALGLSGHPEADEALRALQGQQLQSKTGPVVAEALRAHEIISEQGLFGYYLQTPDR